ncbi:MAG TPA: DUF2399 domain-containing protein [Acidimicrobiales bacterium]|nr:DUF2399 domain-containing protein [Acidimicrobiales bacterium]
MTAAGATDRPSLLAPGLRPVWDAVRRRLERHGVDNRGRVRLPEVPATARLTLQAVIGRRPGATLDLAALERGLCDLGVGDDLPAAIGALGCPVSDVAARRRAERRSAAAAREAARAEAGGWREPWRVAWIDGVVRAGGLRGLGPEAAVDLVRQVRTLLDELDTGPAGGGAPAPLSRVDLAARLFGSAHALDTGTRLEAAATRALALRQVGADPRDLWERAGAHLDLTSGPALTWRLPLAPDSALAGLARQATDLGLPLHLTRFALRRHPVTVAPGTDVLVVENPRVAEAAAQLGAATPVVATNGNPSGAVRLLVDQLLAAGAMLRYHGDFDAAGLAICARMAHLGLTPWRMDTAHYLAALAAAEADGVELPTDPEPAPPTPWDPSLGSTFDRHRLAVHEERLLPGLLEP